jgi:hypothetical protein
MDFDVAVYLGTLPKIKNHNLKVQVLRAFGDGAKAAGARVCVPTDRELVSARLAVMIGWVGMNFSGPHIYFRRDIIEHQKTIGGSVMPIDGSCFKFATQGDLWLRYSLDNVFYNSGFYANQNATDQHWQQIQQSLGVRLASWRESGQHILICLQRDSGWNAKGFDQNRWLRKTIKTIRSHSQRPIMIRPHPAAKEPLDISAYKDNIRVSDSVNRSLDQDLQGCHAAVFFNSSSSVAAVLAGIPIFVSDDDAVTWQIANRDVSQIESPQMPPREQWLYDLSAAHWTMEQSRRGDIYRHFLPYLPT